MKAKHLLPLAALALPLCMQAKPAYPGVLKHVNPDGTVTEIRLHGDETFSYITDTEGMLVKVASDGAVSYERASDGSLIQATPEIIGNMYQAMLDAEPQGAMRSAPSRMAALDIDGRTVYPTSGETRSLVVLMQYSDVKFQPNSEQDIKDMLNKEGYNKFGCNGSVRDYYIYNSNGQYTPYFDVSPIVTLPNTSYYYTSDGSGSARDGKYARFTEAIKYALDAIDDVIDFSKYDYDKDGFIDTVYFYYAGYGQADTPPLSRQVIWPHSSSLAYYGWNYDGVTMGSYACSNELNGLEHYYNKDNYVDGIGTFVHEFGHVLGMPDLYDPNYNSSAITPGSWDIMDGGSYNNDGYCPPNLSAYEKWMYKWIDYTAPEDGKHYDLKPTHDGGVALRVPVVRSSGKEMDTEYFLLEARDQKDWDAYINDHGMLVWHIQYSNSVWTSNRVNSTVGHPRVHIVAADGSANWKKGSVGNPQRATFPGSNVGNHYITPDTEVALDCYTPNLLANPLDVYITSIDYDDETSTVSLDYNKIRENPEIDVTMKAPLRTSNAEGQPTAGFILSWEPVADVDSYQLTVYRLTSSGKKVYESGYEELNVGNKTMVEFPKLTSSKMGFEYHAYVRAFKGLPAKNTSNEVVFIPKEITDVSGVESAVTDTEAPIYGVQGSIVAPAGAEIYNLAGVRMATSQGLEAGIYIVRAGNRVVKVTVR